MSYGVFCDDNAEEATLPELRHRDIAATHLTDVPGPDVH
jgi:hypothetical protein